MRLVFYGNGAFACPALEALLASRHEILAVVTRPDVHVVRRHGRRGGSALSATDVKTLAQARGMKPVLLERADSPESLDLVQTLGPDAGVVADYGQKIPPRVFGAPPCGFLCLHPSLLPQYRGATPVVHALLDGLSATGVTAFRIAEKLDDGDLLGQRTEPIAPEDTALSLLGRLSRAGADLLLRVLDGLEDGTLRPTPQDGSRATRTYELPKDVNRLDWSLPAVTLERQVRAFFPKPLAYAVLPTAGGPVRAGILEAAAIPDDPPWGLAFAPPRPPADPGRPLAAGGPESRIPPALRPERKVPWPQTGRDVPRPGTIVQADRREGLAIRAGDGLFRLLRLRPEGRRQDMAADVFLCGNRVTRGTFML